jgi:hypothetical protein
MTPEHIMQTRSTLLTDFRGCTKCWLAIFHQLFQKVTAQIPSKFRLNF